MNRDFLLGLFAGVLCWLVDDLLRRWRTARWERWLAERTVRGYVVTRSNRAWTLLHHDMRQPTYTSRPAEPLPAWLTRCAETTTTPTETTR